MSNGFIARWKGKVFAASASLFQMGGGSGAFGSQGNLSCQAFAGQNPGATGADNVLAVYSLPANSLNLAGKTLQISAQGGFANNTNAKRCKIIVGCTTAVVGSTVSGGTTIADTGSYSTTGACGWFLQAGITKYGANGSNTQQGQEEATIIAATHGGVGVPTALTLTENAAILIAVTGNATTTATDITLNQFTITAGN